MSPRQTCVPLECEHGAGLTTLAAPPAAHGIVVPAKQADYARRRSIRGIDHQTGRTNLCVPNSPQVNTPLEDNLVRDYREIAEFGAYRVLLRKWFRFAAYMAASAWRISVSASGP